MSFFRAILAVLLGFGFFPLLIGMEKEQSSTTFKYSNPYFDPELQKTLTLIMLKNRNAQEVAALDQDALKIIAQNSYSFYKKEQFLRKNSYTSNSDSDWCNRRGIFNDPERRRIFQGEEIWFTDFDFVTMNDEGREIFKRISYNIPPETKNHPYSHNTIDQKSLEILKQCHGTSHAIFTEDTYNAVLKVPLRLRSKVGKLCTVKVMGEAEKDTFGRWYIFGMTCAGGCIGALISDDSHVVAIGAIVANRLGNIARILDHQENIKDGIIRFKVIEKSIITLEEQKMMKQKELAKFMNERIKAENFEQLPQELSGRIQLDLLTLRNKA